VRGVARGLGGLAGNAGLLAVIGVAWLAAGGAAAAPAPELFKLTIRATETVDFDHTGLTTESGDCATSARAEGNMTVRFGTRRPVLVRFVDGRLRAVDVRPLDGTAVLHGVNEIDEVCSPAQTLTGMPEYCRATTRTFRGAAARLRGPSRGTIAIALSRLRLRPIDCPREPDALRQTPLGRAPGPLHISTAALASSRTTRIRLTASAGRTLTYGAPERGLLLQRTAWTFTFVRVR
jgi:hypothetical protein